TSEVNDGHFVSCLRVTGQRPGTTRFRIIRMASDADNLQRVGRRPAASALGAGQNRSREHRRCCYRQGLFDEISPRYRLLPHIVNCLRGLFSGTKPPSRYARPADGGDPALGSSAFISSTLPVLVV